MKSEDTNAESKDQQHLAIERFIDTQKAISARSIYIGFGLAALCFTLLSSSPGTEVARSLTTGLPRHLVIWSACMGVGAVIIDYLQNLCSYLVIEKAVSNEKQGFEYSKSWFYHIAFSLFWIKQIFVLICTGLFFYAFILSV